jgi:transposase
MEYYSIPATERTMKIQEVILKAMSGQIHWIQAAEIIGISDRSMRRWRQRYEKGGYDGLFDRRTKRPSPKRIPMKTAEQILHLYRERYFDFNVKHFHEKLQVEHGIRISYSWVKIALQEAGLVAKESQRGSHRKRRPRRPLPGMLLFQDGSTHEWVPGLEPMDLVVLLDDATTEVYEADFVPQEDTRTCLSQIKAVVEKKGLFCALYTDRGSHFTTTRHNTGPHKYHATSQGPTQIERALQELGSQLIPANSPQARGRMERFFGTWQGRLPQELRDRGIHTREEAIRFLKRVWIPKHNRTWTVPPEQQGTAFVPCKRTDLDRTFSVQHERVAAADNTVQFENSLFQLEPSPLRVSFAKCHVTVYEHLDGRLEIGYGPHTLGCYRTDGTPLKTKLKCAA